MDKRLQSPSLLEVQEELRKAISFRRRYGQSRSLRAQSWIEKDRVFVYADGYLSRLTEGLKDTYEAVFRVLGEASFSIVVSQYVEKHPSHTFDLGNVGHHLPTFLSTHTISKELPFLEDLARLEWELSQSFHAEAKKAITPKEVEEISPSAWSTLRLEFQPTVKVIQSKWAVYELWRKRTLSDEELHIEDMTKASNVLIYRNGYELMTQALPSPEAQTLVSLLSGESVSQAMQDMNAVSRATDITAWFSRWMQLGLICGLSYENEA